MNTVEQPSTTSTITDAPDYAQKKGQAFKVTLAWSKHHTGSFNMSHSHAVQLRNELNRKLDEHDAAALKRIEDASAALRGDPSVLVREEQLHELPVKWFSADDVIYGDWTKEGSGEWRHTLGGPSLRDKILITHWEPLTIVRVPEIAQ